MGRLLRSLRSLAMTKRECSLVMTPHSVIARAQPEAISSLHIPFTIKCFEGIASPDCHQARNDVRRLFARNDIVCYKLPITSLQFCSFRLIKVYNKCSGTNRQNFCILLIINKLKIIIVKLGNKAKCFFKNL